MMQSSSRFFTCMAVALIVAACGGGDAGPTTSSMPVVATTQAVSALPSTSTSIAPVTSSPTTSSPPAITPIASGPVAEFIASWNGTTGQGVVLAIAAPGRANEFYAAGFADQAETQQLTPDDVFYIGSMTKPVVATVVMQLVEEGAVDLDATVDTYLPGILTGESVTVRHLLSHRSGVFNFTEDPAFAAELVADPFAVLTPRDVVERALAGERHFAPDERFAYSNTNYTILGLVIEAATGNTLADELRQRVFQPLGLDDARLAGESGRTVVNGFADLDGDSEPDSTEAYLDSTTYTVAWAAGGLAMTVEELVLFVRAAYGGQLLNEDSIAAMTTSKDGDGRGLELFAAAPYGLGIFLEENRGEITWSHSGLIPGYFGKFVYYPDDGMAVAALANGTRADVSALLEAVLRIARDG